MSLASQISSLATRIATEFDSVRTAIAAVYTKPSGGIPKTDLDSGVQVSLLAADTLWAHQPSLISLGAAPASAGVPRGGTAGQVLTAVPSIAAKMEWDDLPADAVESVNGKTGVVVLSASDVGAGTSNLALGTTGATAKAGNYQPTAANISDSSAVGRELLTTATVATAQSILGISALPDIQTTSFNGSVNQITATSFTQVPNLASISFTTSAPVVVEVIFSAWLASTGDGDLRAGIAISGAYGTEAAAEPSWGSVMYLPGAYGSTLRGETVKRVVIPQGSTIFTPQAYVTGAGYKGVNFCLFQVIPIRWA